DLPRSAGCVTPGPSVTPAPGACLPRGGPGGLGTPGGGLTESSLRAVNGGGSVLTRRPNQPLQPRAAARAGEAVAGYPRPAAELSVRLDRATWGKPCAETASSHNPVSRRAGVTPRSRPGAAAP